jgi:hypothetical protein
MQNQKYRIRYKASIENGFQLIAAIKRISDLSICFLIDRRGQAFQDNQIGNLSARARPCRKENDIVAL